MISANISNPDDIAASLLGDYDDRVRKAQKIADSLRDKYILEGRSFSFETVMSHESKIEVMRRAHLAGFHVTLLFVGTEDPRINVDRVDARVALGGHSMPHEKIVERYSRTMRLLWNAILAAHQTIIFDNTYLSAHPRAVLKISIDPVKPREPAVELLNTRDRLPEWVTRFPLP